MATEAIRDMTHIVAGPTPTADPSPRRANRPMSHPPGTILGMSRHPLAALTTRLRTWTLLHLQRVVVLDTETTDLDGQICELSIVDAHGTILLDTLIRPTCPITPAARAVHGIIDEDLAGAPTLAQLWPMIAWLLHDARIAAYNAPFDRDALIRSCAAHGIDPGPAADPRRWTCIMRARSRVERRRWQRLDAGHRALGDAQAAREVLDAIAHGRLLATVA